MCLCLVPTYPWKGYRGVGANRRGKSEGGGVGEKEKGGERREERRRGRGEVRKRERRGHREGGMRATNTL